MDREDLKNIKNELAKRKAANYKFQKGGKLTKSTIESYTDEKLQELIEDYYRNDTPRLMIEIKELVDSMFSKWSDDSDDNIIVLDAAYCPEKKIIEIGHALDDIDFTNNALYNPIGRFWKGLNYVSRAKMSEKELERVDNTIRNPFYEDTDKLLNKVYDLLGVENASDYFENSIDFLSECWYGVIGVMKNYEIVSFITRDDGIVSEERSIG